MKNSFIEITMILLMITFLVSCGNPNESGYSNPKSYNEIDDNTSTIDSFILEAPLEDHDNKATGIYKGYIIGSENECIVVIKVSDGINDNLNAELQIASKDVYITKTSESIKNSYQYVFKFDIQEINNLFDLEIRISEVGSLSNSISYLNSDAPVEFSAFKEKTDCLINIWNGSYFGNGDGVVYFLQIGTEVRGTMVGSAKYHFVADVLENSVSGQMYDEYHQVISGSVFSGEITAENVLGEWNSNNFSGTYRVNKVF